MKNSKSLRCAPFVSFFVVTYNFLILATKKPKSLRYASFVGIFRSFATKKPSVSLSCGQMRKAFFTSG